MAEDNSSAMNLDLNLGPIDSSSEDSGDLIESYPIGTMNLEDWLDSPLRAHHRSYRWRQIPVPQQTRDLALEGNIASDVRPDEEDNEEKKDCGGGNINSEEGSFFDCNICLDLSKDPVVTCCGHLFCWPCLYRWLHHHSDAKECPVCKGEVTAKNVTPIYGRGDNKNNTSSTLGEGMESRLKIPLRPQARRVESWRQAIQRSAFTVPMEEMIRRLGSSFDLSRELSQLQANNNNNNNNNNNINRRISSLLLRRSSLHRANSISNLALAMQPTESLAGVETYFDNNETVGRYQGGGLYGDDRDSVSSIAAIIQSESQTVDNAVEIDSRVSLSTSSSRRRVDASRISDIDSGDSRVHRRRRLN